jgi:hypothetical protein
MQGLHHATAPQRHVADQLVQFMGHLQRGVMPWFVRIVPDPCVMDGCPAQAVIYCMACKNPICLAHAHVSHRGEGICDDCVAQLMGEEGRQRQQRQAPADAQKIAWAYRIMKLKRSATLKEVNQQFRKLMAENHPDRAKTEPQRQRKQKRSAEISEAFHVLKRHLESRKEAA